MRQVKRAPGPYPRGRGCWWVGLLSDGARRTGAVIGRFCGLDKITGVGGRGPWTGAVGYSGVIRGGFVRNWLDKATPPNFLICPKRDIIPIFSL